MIDDPSKVTETQMESWVRDFDSWEVCDQVIMNDFEKTSFAWEKAVSWCGDSDEFVKRAGFVMMARLAVSDKVARDTEIKLTKKPKNTNGNIRIRLREPSNLTAAVTSKKIAKLPRVL